jgi:hypothetical protein
MAVLTRRSRVVSFRVSEEEYQDLVHICLTRQARSISDFARFVTLSHFDANPSEGTSESALQQIHRKLGVIDRELRRLVGLMEPERPDEAGPPEHLTSSRAPWLAEAK